MSKLTCSFPFLCVQEDAVTGHSFYFLLITLIIPCLIKICFS